MKEPMEDMSPEAHQVALAAMAGKQSPESKAPAVPNPNEQQMGSEVQIQTTPELQKMPPGSKVTIEGTIKSSDGGMTTIQVAGVNPSGGMSAGSSDGDLMAEMKKAKGV